MTDPALDFATLIASVFFMLCIVAHIETAFSFMRRLIFGRPDNSQKNRPSNYNVMTVASYGSNDPYDQERDLR